jgi:hypothetical protein
MRGLACLVLTATADLDFVEEEEEVKVVMLAVEWLDVLTRRKKSLDPMQVLDP